MSVEMLSQPPLLLTSLAGLGAGLAAAGLAGPMACAWPAKGEAMLRRLNAVKLYRRPGAARTAVGRLLLAVLLAGGALTAYAAAPSEPERAPAQATRATAPAARPVQKITKMAEPPTLAPAERPAGGWTLASLGPTATSPIPEAAPILAPPPAPQAAVDAGPDSASAVAIKLTKDEASQAERVILGKCLSCHSVDPIIATHLSRAGWQSLLGSMVGVSGMPGRSPYDPVLSDTETALVLRYLVENFGPPASPEQGAKG